MSKGPYRPDAVDPSQQAAHDQKIVQIVELGGVPPFSRVEGKAEVAVTKQAFALPIGQRGDDRELVLGQFYRKSMFFDDLFVGPAVGAIEFNDQRFGIFDPDLINPVFVTVQSQGATIADIPQAFDGIHDEAWGEGLKGVLGIVHSGRIFRKMG